MDLGLVQGTSKVLVPDFLSTDVHFGEFAVSPSLSVDPDALYIHIGALHNGEAGHKTLHMSSSLLGNLFQPQSDRLQLLAITLRLATPCTVGAFSNTFTMPQSYGGNKGISAVQLTMKRNTNVKSEHLSITMEE